MLYQTLAQPMLFLCFFASGIFCGILLNFKNVLLKLFKKNNFFYHFIDFLAFLIIFFIYFFINLKINYGEFRFFSLLTFLLSLLLENFVIRSFVAKLLHTWYNKMKGEKVGKRKK